MSYELFEKIINHLGRIDELVTQGLGEPTLNPDLARMIKVASDSGKIRRITFNTCLMIEDHDFLELFREYFVNGLTFVYVSVDTFDPETIRNTRPGTDVAMLKSRINALTKEFPGRVGARITFSNVNSEEFSSTLDELYRLGIRHVAIQHIIDNYKKGVRFGAEEAHRHLSGILKRFRGMIAFEIDSDNECTSLYTNIVINALGNIVPCCRITDDSIISFGSARELNAVINSADFSFYRRTFYRTMPFFCKDCPLYPQKRSTDRGK
jgi:radical SAM protein with 4Fe4S-binding SPASM domain